MAEIIVGGTGSRRAVASSDENRLLTESKSRPSEEVDAEQGRTFVLHGRCHLSATTSGGLLYFKNLSNTSNVILTRFYVDSFTLTNPIILSFVKNPLTVAGGSDIGSIGIIQKNFNLRMTLDATLKISNAISNITFTGGQEYHSIPINSFSSLSREMKGTNIITPNTDLVIGWETESGNAVDGEIISLSINVFSKEV